MIDPLGAVITELRTANIASGRVRGAEPASESDGYEGDALPLGRYKRFVVLSHLGYRRGKNGRLPVQWVRVGVRAYGVTPQDARDLIGDISDALDNAGPRIVGSTPLHQTLDDIGQGGAKDPDTGQPYESGVFEVIAGT